MCIGRLDASRGLYGVEGCLLVDGHNAEQGIFSAFLLNSIGVYSRCGLSLRINLHLSFASSRDSFSLSVSRACL